MRGRRLHLNKAQNVYASVVCTGLLFMGLPHLSADAAESIPWANSSVSYRNTVSAISLDPGAEMTYNPFYSMGLSFVPRWDFESDFFVSASMALNHELTNADAQTKRGETWPTDLVLNLGTRGWQLRGPKLIVTASLAATLPTSPLSQAQTLLTRIGPRMGILRTFAILEGLTIGYGLSMTRGFFRYTTAERDSPTIAACRGIQCARLVNTGVRNARWQQSHAVNVIMQWQKWWGTSASAGVAVSHLFPGALTPASERVPIEPTDLRFAAIYGLESTFFIGRGIGVGVGLSTASPQLAPNSTYYAPFYNRFSQIYVDLRFALGGGLVTLDQG